MAEFIAVYGAEMWDHGRCPWHEFALLARELTGLRALGKLLMMDAVDLSLASLTSEGGTQRAAELKQLQRQAFDYWTPEYAERKMLDSKSRS